MPQSHPPTHLAPLDGAAVQVKGHHPRGHVLPNVQVGAQLHAVLLKQSKKRQATMFREQWDWTAYCPVSRLLPSSMRLSFNGNKKGLL